MEGGVEAEATTLGVRDTKHEGERGFVDVLHSIVFKVPKSGFFEESLCH